MTDSLDASSELGGRGALVVALVGVSARSVLGARRFGLRDKGHSVYTGESDYEGERR